MATGAEAIQLNTKTKKPVNPLIDFSTVTDFRLGSLSVTDTAGIKTWALGSTNGTKLGATGDKLGFLGATPIVRPSGNVFTALTNLGLITSPTLTEANVTGLVTDLAGKQPLDSDLTAIAALTTTAYGRGALELANGTAFISYIGKTTLAGYGITDAQGLDSDLTAIAALSTDSFGRDLLTKTDGAAVRSYIGAGTSSFSGAYADLSGLPTLPANTTATPTQFFTAYNSTTGAFTKVQPAFTDISGTALKAQIPAVTAFTDAANTFVPLQTFNSLATYAATATQLSNPGAPTIVNVGTAGATTWRYRIVAVLADGNTTAAGTAGVTTTGNATLDATNKNSLTWSAVVGAASYDVYRTTAGLVPSTTGKIANVTSPAYVDAGAAGDSASAPSVNNTGSINATHGTYLGNVAVTGNLSGQVQPLAGSTLNYIDVRWHGVDVTGAVDSTTEFNLARTAARTAGAALYIPGVVKISSTIAITARETWVGTNWDLDGNGTRLLWAGGSGATMVTMTNVEGGGMSNIIFDCNALAAYGVIFDGCTHLWCNNLAAKGFTTGTGFKLQALTHTCSWNTFGHLASKSTGNGDSCIWISGCAPGGTTNSCWNTFINTATESKDGIRQGIRLGNCDSNAFIGTTWADCVNTTLSYGVYCDETETSGGERPNGNSFECLSAGGLGFWKGNGNTSAGQRVAFYLKTNGEADPTGSSQMYWHDEYGNDHLNYLYVFGDAAVGGNVTAQSFIGTNATTAAEGAFALRAHAYGSTFQSVYLYQGDSAVAGDFFTGIPKADLGALIFQNNTNSVIGNNTGGPIIFAPGGEVARVSSSGFTIGSGGSAITKILKNDYTWNVPSTANGSYAYTDVTFTGVADGDFISVSPSNFYGVLTVAILGANSIRLVYNNDTGSTQDPPSYTFRVVVIKFA